MTRQHRPNPYRTEGHDFKTYNSGIGISPPLSAFTFDPVRLVCDEFGRRGHYRKQTRSIVTAPISSGLIC